MAGRAKARRLGNADLAGSIAAAAHGAKSRIEALDAASVGTVAGAGDYGLPTYPGIVVGNPLDPNILVSGMYPTGTTVDSSGNPYDPLTGVQLED